MTPKPICDICQSKIQGILVFTYSQYPPLFFPPENLIFILQCS